jgi:hypothetical protein
MHYAICDQTQWCIMQAKQYDFTITPAALAPLPIVSWRRRDAVGGTAAGANSQSQVSAASTRSNIEHTSSTHLQESSVTIFMFRVGADAR